MTCSDLGAKSTRHHLTKPTTVQECTASTWFSRLLLALEEEGRDLLYPDLLTLFYTPTKSSLLLYIVQNVQIFFLSATIHRSIHVESLAPVGSAWMEILSFSTFQMLLVVISIVCNQIPRLGSRFERKNRSSKWQICGIILDPCKLYTWRILTNQLKCLSCC
jgi:hypothetical protein